METTIILTAIDVEKFKLFQKHYDLFSKLEENEIFKMQFGKCILNIAFGTLQNIVKEEVVYRKPQ